MSANVSTAYKEQFNRNVRNPSNVVVRMKLGDKDLMSASTVDSPSSLFLGDTDGAISIFGKSLDRVKAGESDKWYMNKQYASLEEGFLRLDGSMLFVPNMSAFGSAQGYVGNCLYNNGYEWVQSMVIELDKTASFYGIKVVLAPPGSSFYSITKLRVTARNGNTLVKDLIVDCNSTIVNIEEGFDNVNKIYLEAVEGKPNTRARIHYVELGIDKEFTGKNLISCEEKRYIDVLSTNLPINDFTFTISNINHEFDIDNPQGLYKYIENSTSVVEYFYEYELDNGEIERFKGGSVLSNGEMTTNISDNGTTATFVTLDHINNMDDVYYNGTCFWVYTDKLTSYYDIAEYLLIKEAGLSKGQFVLSDKLQRYSTRVPLPQLEIKNLLKLIANACMCVFYVDRDGVVHIEEMNEESEDFYLDFNKSRTAPVLDKKYPLIHSIETYLNSTSYGDTEELIAETTLDMMGEYELEFTHEPFSQTNVVVTNGTWTGRTYYARRTIVNVEAQENCNVKVYGRRLVTTKQVQSRKLNDSGEVLYIENELIDNKSQLAAYLAWVEKYATMRNKYSVDYVGNPEVDVGRIITAQTRFKENAPAILTNNNIKFAGALSGHATFLLTTE